AAAFEHALDVGQLVARADDEAGAMSANLLVLGGSDLERLRAGLVAARADVQAHRRVVGPHPRELGDVLVDGAEPDLVPGVVRVRDRRLGFRRVRQKRRRAAIMPAPLSLSLRVALSAVHESSVVGTNPRTGLNPATR